MSPLPAILTHTYHPDYGPLGNLCELPRAEAAARLLQWRAPRPAYLDRRLAVEDWLIAESRKLIAGIRLDRPRYFFLGDFTDGRDPHRPSSITVPLSVIPPESVTFTYPDSMTSFLYATRGDLAADRLSHHGQVFTLAGIEELVQRIGMPERCWSRAIGAPSVGFIEAQIWDDAPVRAWLADGARSHAADAVRSP